jgi:hypothetical protein
MTPASRAFTRTLRLVLQSLPHCATLTIVCIRATQCAAAPPPQGFPCVTLLATALDIKFGAQHTDVRMQPR